MRRGVEAAGGVGVGKCAETGQTDGVQMRLPPSIKIVLVTTALLLAAGLTALPLAWMAEGSLHAAGTTAATSGGGISLGNYRELLVMHPAIVWFANSLFVAGMQTLIAVGACTLAGYVLAQHRFTFRRRLMVMLMATLLLPSQVALPAAWQLMLKCHLLDSYLALLLPSAANVFGVFLFRHACAQLPTEMLDAARMDGCGEWRSWWEIVLPVIQPTLVTFAVLSFTANWNAYLWPQILLQDPGKYTLAMGLANLSTLPHQRANLGLLLAATTLSILPCLALFIAARKSLDSSLVEGMGK